VDRRAKVELFEQIRRELSMRGTIRGIAKKLGIIGHGREAVLSAGSDRAKDTGARTTRIAEGSG